MKTYALCGFLAVCALAAGNAAAQESVGEKVFQSGIKSTVMVMEGGGHGTGSVINVQGGFILTNWHVVRRATKVKIIFPMWEDGKLVREAKKYRDKRQILGIDADVLATNQTVDLAIVKIKDPTKIPPGTEAVNFATDAPGSGAKIHSIGNPEEDVWIYTPGEVRTVKPKEWVSGSKGKLLMKHKAMVILTTSPTNPGDSGGPLFNDKGEQVGTTQGYDGESRAVSIFIDMSEAKKLLETKEVPYVAGGQMVGVLKEKYEPERKADTAVVGPATETAPMADPAADKARQEKAAAAELKVLRLKTSDPTRKEFAVSHLRSLIERFPDTAAAKEAEQMLSKLQ